MMEEEDDDDDDEEDDDDDDDRSQSSRDTPHGNAVLSELASLVQGPEHAHECRTFPVPTFDAQRARHAR
jgi:TATA-binding protein-associated factor Taf7